MKYKNPQNNVERKGDIVISYSFVALWSPGKVKSVLRVVALATLQNLRGTSRHLEESTIWPGKVVPREVFGPGITRKVTILLIK